MLCLTTKQVEVGGLDFVQCSRHS